jgi:OmpA-OmpF porin, OOP family
MNRKAITAVAIGLGAACASAAHAAGGPGWYGGVSLGRSVEQLGGGAIDGALANQGLASSSSLDHHGTSYNLFAGYEINPNFAVEGGYVNLGRFDFSSAVAAPAADTVSGRYEAKGVDAAAVGILPFADKWSAFGKAGLLYAKTSLDAESTGAVAVSGANHWGTSPLLGAGIGYDLTRNVSLRAEWDRYFSVGDSSTGKGDIDQYTVGVAYRF